MCVSIIVFGRQELGGDIPAMPYSNVEHADESVIILIDS